MIKKLCGVVMSAALLLSVSIPVLASEIQVQPRNVDSVQNVVDAVVEGVQVGYNLGMSTILTPADMAR